MIWVEQTRQFDFLEITQVPQRDRADANRAP